MSWLFSQALVAAYSEENSSAGLPSAQLSVMPTPHPFWHGDKTTDFSGPSRFGLTCAALTDAHGEAVLTWFREAFLARTSAQRAKVPVSRAAEAACGGSLLESFAKWDLDSCSWKTHQFSLAGDLEPFSEIWPRWGMMRGGESYLRPTPSGLEAHRSWISSANVSGSLPTLRASDAERGGRGDLIQALRGNPNTHYRMPTLTVCGNYNRKGVSPQSGDGLATVVRRMQTLVADDSVNREKGKFNSRGEPKLSGQIGGPLNPTWCEWFMGFPMEWTALDDSVTARFQQWLRSHGRF